MNRSRSVRMWLRIACFLLVAALIHGNGTVHGEEPIESGKSPQASIWMKKKLDYSQNILNGLTTADFDKVIKNAEEMRRLSKIESFVRGGTPGYRAQLVLFEESADEIIRQAKKDNVEGATLAFTQLTISCVNCHKEIRGKSTE